jgi:hypothetical protein
LTASHSAPRATVSRLVRPQKACLARSDMRAIVSSSGPVPNAWPDAARSRPRCPGFSEIDTMPSWASQSAKSAWSLGPWPQMPTYLPVARQAAMAREIIALTAGSRSSKSPASCSSPESRSRPKVNWVRSLLPIDMPSKCSRNCSARMALLGLRTS